MPQLARTHADTSADLPPDLPARPHARPLFVAVLGKGGVGKTSTVASLGDALQQATGWSVLLIDLDPLASLSGWLAPNWTTSSVEVLDGTSTIDSAFEPLRAGLGLLATHEGLSAHAGALDGAHLREWAATLDADVVIIDTPAAQPLTVDAGPLRAALDVADVVVVPHGLGGVQADALGLVLLDVEPRIAESARGVRVLLLPANVDNVDVAQQASELVGAVRPDLGVLPPVKHGPAMRKAQTRRVLLSGAGRSATLNDYRAVGEALLVELADKVRGAGGR